MEKLREQVLEQEELIVQSKRDYDTSQSEIGRIQQVTRCTPAVAHGRCFSPDAPAVCYASYC